MAAQRWHADDDEAADAPALVAPASRRTADDDLATARGIGWGLLLAVAGFWIPMLALGRWLRR